MSQYIRPEDWQPADGIVLEQTARRVVTSRDNISVIAGPGAGKTELLAQRALYLLQTGKCPLPQRILAISFKRDVAKNLKDRVAQRCSTNQANRFDSFTFDAFSKSFVDRFLNLIPEWCRPPKEYSIFFPNHNNWDEFLNGIEPPEELGGEFAARAIRLKDAETRDPMPLQPGNHRDIADWIRAEWWRHCLDGGQPSISFPMIGNLARTILAHNPQVLKALRLTYSHVFLDEFQDTTGPQYKLIRLAFLDSRTILTAVGDTKQRIMTWAGAEAEVFSWFDENFLAQREMLQMNHRSNARIVQIINDLVSEIEPNAVETICARQSDPVSEDSAAFWVFDTDADEAEKVAGFISEDIEENEGAGRCPDDFCLLVRVRANQIEDQLTPMPFG